MSIPVCSGGTISAGGNSITFTNSNSNTSYTITSCKSSNGVNMPGWPTNSNPVVPAAQNGVNGSVTVVLATAAVVGTYTYITNPLCPSATNPVIHVQ